MLIVCAGVQARRSCLAGLDAGTFAALTEHQRMFALMPLMHAEDLAVQEVRVG